MLRIRVIYCNWIISVHSGLPFLEGLNYFFVLSIQSCYFLCIIIGSSLLRCVPVSLTISGCVNYLCVLAVEHLSQKAGS
jgi:hypothetical protein